MNCTINQRHRNRVNVKKLTLKYCKKTLRRYNKYISFWSIFMLCTFFLFIWFYSQISFLAAWFATLLSVKRHAAHAHHFHPSAQLRVILTIIWKQIIPIDSNFSFFTNNKLFQNIKIYTIFKYQETLGTAVLCKFS